MTSPALRIRQAAATDIGPVSDLAQTAFAPYAPLIGKLPAPALYDYAALIETGRVTVATVSDEVVGLLYVYPESDGAVMLDVLAVSGQARGQGVAGALVQKGEDQARAMGADVMRVYTNAVMEAPQRLYPRLGYVETHRGESDGYQRVHYEKAL